MAGSRRRALTAEERSLWRQVAESATPLRPAHEPAPAAPRLVLPEKPPISNPPLTLPQPIQAEPGRVTLDLAPETPSALARAHPHMDRRRFDQLRRGRLAPEARLDLHGMTAERAHSALIGFIGAAHARGIRLVLIITGKGRSETDHAPAARRHGILRHSVPHWLATAPVRAKILQIAPAHQRHGGGGAFYVYLRRQK
jgi:DNA-nicking Smr family endonuclease